MLNFVAPSGIAAYAREYANGFCSNCVGQLLAGPQTVADNSSAQLFALVPPRNQSSPAAKQNVEDLKQIGMLGV
jgi:hypothetical protein